MCTVTFIPKETGFILSSTRDEHRARRKAEPPRSHFIHGKQIYFPKDLQAGGTWIASSQEGITLCLLNGAFEAHRHEPPYRMSRGIMLLNYFRMDDFKNDFNFSGIEPFTLLILKNGNHLTLEELRWDGNKIFHRIIDHSVPHIWQSATLYLPEIRKTREGWFNHWLKGNIPFTMEDVVSFYKTAGSDDKRNAYIMNREEVFSVSLTSVEQIKSSMKMRYEDLISRKVQFLEWKINKNVLI